ncbi:XRE family transcriptional regulator [Pseudolactococcus plantarum]|uniref:Phage transcription repressor n=1 Tax=Pseudolactococcus plantarum TaxID=1365 RepID=A0A2A5RWJ3_9LACT|nr:XRE family transcriptional regulator [Lactococcus plantarum]PCS05592.1 phage transcription repressor [Lactococcus plantarum]HCN73874.1 XRE family transcriptional regulator [Lactococcus sp.]
MITFERVKFLANKQGKSLNKVEEDLGFAKNSLYALKRNKPSIDRIVKLADYFHVTDAYLLGRVDNPEIFDWDSVVGAEKEPSEKPKQPVDLADLVDDSKINWDDWVSFDGKPLTDEVKTAMKLILGKRLED